MFRHVRSNLWIGFGVALWGASFATAQAQFGGLQIEVGRYGRGYGGSGLYGGGFDVPFGVGPSIPLSSRASLGLQYQSGYRGYYGVAPSLGIDYYSSPYSRNYGYSNYQDSLNQQQLQQYQLQLCAEQLRLSPQQAFPYSTQSTGPYSGSGASSRYSKQSPRVSPNSSDLRPGMVLPDGSTVISVGPVGPAASSASSQPSVQPNDLPPKVSKPNRAAF